MVARATMRHQRELHRIRGETIHMLARLWPHFDPNDPGSWSKFLGPALVVIGAQHARASAAALRYYDALRAAEVGTGRRVPPPPVVEPPRLDEERTVRALAATGLAGTYGALKAGQSLAAARANGLVRASMSAGRTVLQGGREALMEAVKADGRAVAYVRVADDNPCEWCESLAGQRSGPEAFPAHDGCGCTAEPVFT